MKNVVGVFRVYYGEYQKQIDAFAPRFRSRLSRCIGDLSGSVGAVFNRTGLEYLINSKIHHRLTQTFVYKVC